MKNIISVKKFISCMLLFAIAFSVLTACGKAEQAKDGTDEGGEEELNCYGNKFKLFQEKDTVERPFGYLASTSFADLALARLKEINTRFNCEVDLNMIADCYNYVNTSSATGLTDADIIYCGTGNNGMLLAMGGLLHSFEESDIIDINDHSKYGPLNLQESCMVDGVAYALIPMKWPNKSYEGNIGSFICFNEDIISTHNMPNPRELSESGEWTTVNFSEILPDYAILEGDYVTYSLAAHRSNFVRGFLGANGMRMVAETENGLVEAFDTPAVMNILQWASDFVTANAQYINFLSDYTSFEEFINKYCTMAVIETQWVENIALKVYNFGILPFPCGPDIEYGKQVTFFSTIDAFAIPEMGAEIEPCEYILSALLEPFAGFETEESIMSLLDDTLFFDTRDTQYYASLYKNTQAQYYAISGYTFMENIASTFDRKTPAELIASLKRTNQENIDKYISANYYFIKEQQEANTAD